jgi:hypothetical protein
MQVVFFKNKLPNKKTGETFAINWIKVHFKF